MMSCFWHPRGVPSEVEEDTKCAAERFLIAIQTNNEAYAQELIQQYARLDAGGTASPLYCQDREGWTPLMLAASRGAARLVGMILDAGIADANHASCAPKVNSPSGSTALHECTARAAIGSSGGCWPYLETAWLLLRAGADPFKENSKGLTAVDYANKLGNTELKTLLERKACFRGYLRMKSPAGMFGGSSGQRWTARYCVVTPRMQMDQEEQQPDKAKLACYASSSSSNPLYEEDSLGMEQVPLWLVCYLDESSCQAVSRIPLSGATVNLLPERDNPSVSGKSVLVLDKCHGVNIPGAVVSMVGSPESRKGSHIQVQAPVDNAVRKGSSVLMEFARVVNTCGGVLKRQKTTPLEPPFFTASSIVRNQDRVTLVQNAPTFSLPFKETNRHMLLPPAMPQKLNNRLPALEVAGKEATLSRPSYLPDRAARVAQANRASQYRNMPPEVHPVNARAHQSAAPRLKSPQRTLPTKHIARDSSSSSEDELVKPMEAPSRRAEAGSHQQDPRTAKTAAWLQVHSNPTADFPRVFTVPNMKPLSTLVGAAGATQPAVQKQQTAGIAPRSSASNGKHVGIKTASKQQEAAAIPLPALPGQTAKQSNPGFSGLSETGEVLWYGATNPTPHISPTVAKANTRPSKPLAAPHSRPINGIPQEGSAQAKQQKIPGQRTQLARGTAPHSKPVTTASREVGGT